jgi:hypothetical protein
MNITGDLTAFLADFGVAVTGPSTTSGLGILNQPDKVFGDFMSTEYELTVKTSDFPALVKGDSVTVASVAYTVRETAKEDDGAFTKVRLTKT